MLHDELEIISLIKKTLGTTGPKVIVGIGDDAAVVRPPRGKMLATVDTLVEGVHFDLSYTKPRELGRKAMAVSLSDLAAMGAKPLYALVSVGLKQEMSRFFVEELYIGIRELAREYGVDVIGGNTVQSPTVLLVDVALIGEGDRCLTRSGASPGDVICVTGQLGNSAAGLNLLKRLGRSNIDRKLRRLVASHLTPVPRVKEARIIMKAVTSSIDLSDGLGVDLHRILKASKVGAVIEENKLPISRECREAAKYLSTSHLKWALFGGEDYELLLTIRSREVEPSRKRLKQMGVLLTPIGEVTHSRGARLVNAEGRRSILPPMGWNHFVRRTKV